MTWSKERIDIKDIKDTTEACNIVATIKQRTPLKKFARNKNSGQMITGILCDTTAAIDFVCWTEAALQFDSILLQQKTFKFENVKVVAAREAYSKSLHKFQITIDKTSVLEEVECSPYQPPTCMQISAIKDLLTKEEHAKANVLARVKEIPIPEELPTSKTQALSSYP